MQNWLFGIRSRPFFVLVAAFIVLSILVQSKATQEFDHSVILYFQSIAGNPVLDTTMWAITEIGSVIWLTIFSIVLLIIRKTRRIGLVMLLCLVAGTIGSGYFKGYVIDHPRPALEFLGTQFPYKIGEDTFYFRPLKLKYMPDLMYLAKIMDEQKEEAFKNKDNAAALFDNCLWVILPPVCDEHNPR